MKYQQTTSSIGNNNININNNNNNNSNSTVAVESAGGSHDDDDDDDDDADEILSSSHEQQYKNDKDNDDDDDDDNKSFQMLLNDDSSNMPPSSTRQRPINYRRSDSMDRRLDESIRFLSAIGEDIILLPSSSMIDINQNIDILDDDSANSSSGGEEEEEEEEDSLLVGNNNDSEENENENENEYEIEIESDIIPQHVPSIRRTHKDGFVTVLRNPSYRNLYPTKKKKNKEEEEVDDDGDCNNNTVHQKQQSNPDEIGLLLELELDEYKGIGNFGLERTKRGTERGNYSQLHRKAWLEVSDIDKHRYGKNLRIYYKYWSSIGYPYKKFFDWLDSKGIAEGQPLPDLEDCPRSKLDTDTVLYISDIEVTEGYELRIDVIVNNNNNNNNNVDVDVDGDGDYNGTGRVYDIDGNTVRTGSDGWIFVLRDNKIYGSRKITVVSSSPPSSPSSSSSTSHNNNNEPPTEPTTTMIRHRHRQRFHHSSFFGGKAVTGAGIIVTDDNGYLIKLYPHSGHYRPRERDVQRILYYFNSIVGMSLKTFQVDTQQLIHISRSTSSIRSNSSSPYQQHHQQQSKQQQQQQQHQHQHNANDNTTCTISNSNSNDKNNKKSSKVNCLYLQSAEQVFDFLSHKARCIDEGIFRDIILLSVK